MLVDEPRAMIGALCPPALGELGSLSAVELLLQRSGEDGPEVTLIVQEARSNICRHAQARRADFTFAYEHDGLHVTITDDAMGFVLSTEADAPDGQWALRCLARQCSDRNRQSER
jgi:signal transduction histidine kinase